MSDLCIIGIPDLPEIKKGDDLAQLILSHLPEPLRSGDIVVVTHKMVSKSEGHTVDLRTVTPSALANDFATRYQKDPRLVEVVLSQSQSILRMTRGIIIAKTKHGFTCANAGVDISNTADADCAILLPPDPDRSARNLSSTLSRHYGFTVPVIICDSFGRTWRNGIVNVAIGVANMSCFTDYRHQFDSRGYELQASVLASCDAIASASELVMGKLNRIPATIVRGFAFTPDPQANASQLLMDESKNLFP